MNTYPSGTEQLMQGLIIIFIKKKKKDNTVTQVSLKKFSGNEILTYLNIAFIFSRHHYPV